MQLTLVANIVVAQAPVIFQLLAGECNSLLVSRETFLFVYHKFDAIYRIRRFHE